MRDAFLSAGWTRLAEDRESDPPSSPVVRVISEAEDRELVESLDFKLEGRESDLYLLVTFADSMGNPTSGGIISTLDLRSARVGHWRLAW